MSKKRSHQSELSVQLKLCVSPQNMFALRAATGEVFLLDRNCVLVSRKCREYIESLDKLVLQCSCEIAQRAACVPPSTYNAPPPVLNQTLFYYFVQPAVDADEGGVETFGMTHLPIEMVAEEHQRAVHNSVEPKMGPPSSRDSASKQPTALLPRVNPFGYIEEASGRRLYPAMDLPEISADLLDLAVAFMHYKHKADSEADRRTSAPFSHTIFGEPNYARLMAAGAILDM